MRGGAILLKGVNKRVIIIKNPESEIFEEAYFILKSSAIKGIFKQSKDNEMVIEANRIISDYHNQQRSIIEKNGIASSIGGDISEFDNLLNINNNISQTDKSDKKINNINNTGKPDKNKEDKINHSMSNISDEEIFEDEKFFENMQNNTNKYNNFYKNPDFIGYKPAFNLISSRKVKFKHIPIPPKSFFIGIGFMSLIIILIRLIEYIILG